MIDWDYIGWNITRNENKCLQEILREKATERFAEEIRTEVVPVDKERLKQYRPLKKELELIEKKLDKLYDRALDIPEVLGKVKGSSRDFPYIEVRTTVRMDEPKESDAINRLIGIKEKRRDEVNAMLIEIESFIASIPDSVTRQIFELTYIDGLKQREVAEQVNLDRSRISRKISEYLQNAHKAQE